MTAGVSYQDRGYAFVILVTAFVAQILQNGISWTVGVYYAIFVEVFPESKGTIAGITSLNTALFYAAGPLSSYLTNKFGGRVVTISGGFIGSMGLLLSMYADNVYHLYITFGVLTGFGLGLSYLPIITILGDYFYKWRAIAIGIVASGVGMGQFTHPAMIRYFVDEYGWRGSLLMMAGVTLNICVCGALLRPIPKLSTYKESSNEDDGDDCKKESAHKLLNISTYSIFENQDDKTKSCFPDSNQNIDIRDKTINEDNKDLTCSKIVVTDENDDLVEVRYYTSLAKVHELPMFMSMESLNKKTKKPQNVVLGRLTAMPTSKSSNFVQNTTLSCNNLSMNGAPLKSSYVPVKSTYSTNAINLSDRLKRSPIYKPSGNFYKSSKNGSQSLYRSVLLNGHYNQHQQQYSSNHSLAHANKHKPIYSSAESIVSHLLHPKDRDDLEIDYEEDICNCKPGKNNPINLFIMKNPTYIMLCLNNFGLCFGLSIVSVHLAAYASSHGISADKSAMLFMVNGLANFIGRLTFGVLSQLQFTKNIVLYIVAFTAVGFGTAVCPLYSELYWLMIFAVIYGFFSGCFGPLLPNIVLDIFDIQYLSSAFGYLLVFEATGTLIGAPIAGWIYDITGDYSSSLYLGGAIIILSSVIMTFPKLFEKLCKCPKTKENKQYITVVTNA